MKHPGWVKRHELVIDDQRCPIAMIYEHADGTSTTIACIDDQADADQPPAST